MPRRKTYRRRPRRRRRYRARKSLNRTFWGSQVARPLGNRKKIVTRYVEKDISVNGGISGSAGVYVFSANGLYDPNITGTGHQPIGFDQCMQFYDHYTVIGAKMRVVFSNSVDSSNDQYIGIALSASSTALTDVREYIENGRCRWSVLGKNAGGDATIKSLTHQVGIARFTGKKSILMEDDYRGNVSANPATQVYFHIFGGGFGSSDPSAMSMMVQIDYITVLTEPKILSLS